MGPRVYILDICAKEIRKFPEKLQKDLLMILAQLSRGVRLGMPLSRPMPSIGLGVHELRLKDRGGGYRLIYFFKSKSGKIYFLHAFKKKTQATPRKNLNLAQKRLKDAL